MTNASVPPDPTITLPPALRWLRLIGCMEGISTLALFGIAMPLKYAAGIPMAVTVVGSLHGGLFLLYFATILVVVALYRWPVLRGLSLAVAAIVPFGPFILDRKIPDWHAQDTSGL
jgi:integral membrane protein